MIGRHFYTKLLRIYVSNLEQYVYVHLTKT